MYNHIYNKYLNSVLGLGQDEMKWGTHREHTFKGAKVIKVNAVLCNIFKPKLMQKIQDEQNIKTLNKNRIWQCEAGETESFKTFFVWH